jgi:hypothetical protein
MQTISLSVPKNVFSILLILLSPVVIHAQQLPARWETGMSLTISTGGGMRDYHSETIISDAGITIITEGDDGRKTNQYEVTQQQLDKLLGIMRKNHFESLKSQPRKGLVYDMQTTTTELTWGNHMLGYSVGASVELPEKRKNNASQISTYIFQMIESAANKK